MAGVRVRFAPAPTGFLHVGGARTALFNWLFARHEGGTLVLRIEDTDPERSKQELVDVVLRTLEWLGLDWDEGPVRQSERFDLYRAATEKLLGAGRAYRCHCSRDDVEARAKAEGRRTPGYDGHCRDRGVARGPGVAVRFRSIDEGAVEFDDVVRGRVRFEADVIEDFVIERADGTPTFLLANAVDDAEMAVTHAIRGEDLLNSAPRVLLLMGALSYEERPVYAHLPILVDEKRQKLSKRRHVVAVEDYRARGFLPEAVRNYLALLGWGPPDGVEIRPVEEIVELFRLEDVTKAAAFFDLQKLEHFSGAYVRALPVDEFVERARPWLEGEGTPWPAGAFDEDRFRALAPLVQERVTTLAEVPAWVDFVFLADPVLDGAAWEKVAASRHAAEILDDAAAAFGECEWEAGVLHETLRDVGGRLGLALAEAQAPVRVAVTGRTVGPPLFESLAVLGRDESRRRIRVARERLPDPSPAP